MKKYLVVGGTIKSISDGDVHYISPAQLMHLYQVPRDLCVCVSNWTEKESLTYRGTKLEILHPLSSGNYKPRPTTTEKEIK